MFTVSFLWHSTWSHVAIKFVSNPVAGTTEHPVKLKNMFQFYFTNCYSIGLWIKDCDNNLTSLNIFKVMCKIKGYSFLTSALVGSILRKAEIKQAVNNLSSEPLIFIKLKQFVRFVRIAPNHFQETTCFQSFNKLINFWQCRQYMAMCKQMHQINSALFSKPTTGFIYPALNLKGVLKEASCLNFTGSLMATSSSNFVLTFPWGRSLTDMDTASSLPFTIQSTVGGPNIVGAWDPWSNERAEIMP